MEKDKEYNEIYDILAASLPIIAISFFVAIVLIIGGTKTLKDLGGLLIAISVLLFSGVFARIFYFTQLKEKLIVNDNAKYALGTGACILIIISSIIGMFVGWNYGIINLFILASVLIVIIQKNLPVDNNHIINI
jgi:hypothetical protein